MKIYLDHKIDESGKMKFMQVLIPELKKLGVKFSDYKKADLILGINKFRTGVTDDKHRKIKDKKKRVLRIDGIHFEKSKRNRWGNRVVKEDALRANAIIWQTEFCRDMWKKIMNIRNKKEVVIFNGRDPDDYKNVTPIKSAYKRNVVLCSKWFAGKHRYNKRLHKMWEIAWTYVSSTRDTCFWILGETNGTERNWQKNERIKFVGHLPEDEVKQYLKMADVYLHLSWFSWCDNSLIEAICAGCIPIVSNVGGNAEIAECCNGIVLNLDKPIKAKLMKNVKPPEIEIKPALEAIDQAFEKPPELHIPGVHIKNIAKEYYEVFKEVLR
ncbi:MAG: glycosyltransferase [PVC group bacterium]|nr:glycosyltransferase [PVC group bacterium]